MGPKARQALVDGMKVQWYALQRRIVTTKLSGQVLNRVTGNLASSINAGGPNTASEFLDSGNEIIGRVGTKVRYAAVHEYGGDVKVPAHERMGRPVKAYTAHFKERSFLRSGLQDQGDQIRAAIANAVRQGLGA